MNDSYSVIIKALDAEAQVNALDIKPYILTR